MKNFKIGPRLWVAFAGMTVLIASMAVFAMVQINKLEKDVRSLSQINFVKAQAAASAMEAAQNVIRSAVLIVAVPDPAMRAREREAIEGQRIKYRESLKKIEDLGTDEEGKARIEKAKAIIKVLAAADNKAMELALAGKQAEAAETIRKEAQPLFTPFLQSFTDIAAYQKEKVDQRYSEAQGTIAAAKTGLITACLIAMLIAAASAVLITRSIVVPIRGMRDMLQDIAQGEGDLTKRLDASSKDELGETCHWFNVFIEKLQGIIGRVNNTISQVATASIQVQATAERMAVGAEQVAAQAGTVATASEEMSATSGSIAQSCLYAVEGSRKASEAAQSGAAVVDDTISVMGSIAQRVKDSAVAVERLGGRSDQIGAIVGTIEDIADQTNLLALNAAIEAARAGEQGRGFAVVADEVRALAERTTRATREIGEMIKAIQQETRGAVVAMEEGVSEVAKGSEKAANSGAALRQILDEINEVTAQINQVATAAEEQTATTSEITGNIQQITEVVSQTSVGAQQSATAANELSGLAEELRKVAGQFKLA
jgi:methyl-accepting chemotaxis protein